MLTCLRPAIFLLTLFCCTFPLTAQSFGPEGLSCGTDEARSLRHLADPASQQLEDKLEQQWSDHVHSPRRSMPPPYTLPIVFHIVHNNGPENISDADVIQSLEYTNQAFANTDYYDQGTGAATGVQFCLARRTPDNQPTIGIDRLVSPEFVDLEATAEDRDMKDLLRWNTREYINVYVVKEICGLGLGCGVAGYAYYPSAHGGRVDGVVVEARWLAGDEADASVLVHELGHYLGIRHTFDGGCVNDDCTQDGDFVCDTPPDQSKVAVPCSGSVNSCTTDTDSGFATDQNDMFINYMDYGYWGCYSAFTQGQADRMHFFLDGIRRSLLDSPGCLYPCPAVVTADFTGGGVTVEAGTTVNFTNNSVNGTAYAWRVNGTTFATTTDASFQFTNDGFYEVTLFAEGNPPLCQPDSMVQTVRVQCSLEASFDIGGPTTAGEEKTFVNTSTLATMYEWRIDGNPTSTDADLVHTFPNVGLYEVCLQAENDFCRETVCRNIYVAPVPDTTSTSSDCSASFAFAYRGIFDEVTDGQFTTSFPDGAGGYYAALTINRSPMVVHLAPDGNLLWEVMLFPSGDNGVIQELILDKNGQLAGIGQTVTGQGGQLTPQNFVFRIDPSNGNLLWGRQYFNEGITLELNTIIHPRAGQPYAIFGTTELVDANGTTSRSSIMLQLVQETGDMVGDEATIYIGSSTHSFERALYDDVNQQYRVVGYGRPTTTGDAIYLTTLSPTGDILQAELLGDSFVSDDLLDIAGNENGFAVLANLPTGNISNTPYRLFRFTPDGTPSQGADYYGTSDARVLDLAADAQGYVVLTDFADSAPVLTQLNPTGEVLWARTILITPEYPASAQMLTPESDGGLILGGEAIFDGFETLPHLIKVRPDGTIDGDCLPTAAYDLERDDIDFDLSEAQTVGLSFPLSDEEFFWEPVGLEFAGGDCREPCEEEDEECPPGQNCDPSEICNNLIDDDGDGFVDCDDPDLANDCCCLDGPQRLFGTDTLRCGGITIFTPPLGNLRFLFTNQNGVTSDTLNEFPTQFLSEPGTYIITYIDSCLRTASDSITLHPRSRPMLELGPDTTLCSNAVIPLLAQPGFETYEWVDGSDTRSFTAYDAGTYWVTATDSCGEQQSDTVRVRIEPTTAIELGSDTIICPGDTLTFSLNGFTDYQWSQSSFIDCTNCPTVRFAPTTDTLLLVAAMEGPGCFASDSIRVRIASLEGTNRSADLCPNDTLLLGNQAITQAGVFLDTVPIGSCFRVDTVLVRGLTDTVLTDTLTICAGDSVMLFGTFESEAGSYVQSLPRANGCDSTTVIELNVRANLGTTEFIRVCRGDSALIFGQFEFESGVFQREFTGSGGCDSIHQITLEVNGAVLETEVFSDNCQGGAAGAGEVRITAGVGPFDVLWSNGEVTNQLNDLEAGIYVVSVTNAEGCVVTDSIEIIDRVLPTVELNVQPETCPGEDDGSLTLSGDLTGLSFSLNGSALSAQTFFPNLSPGDYLLSAQDSLGCDQEFAFTIAGATGLFIDLPPEFTVSFGDSLTLVPTTNAADPDQLVWTVAGTVICTACPTLTLRPEATTMVTVSLPDSTNCPATTETIVRVNRDDLFYVPNAFSPNDDGVNDLFRVFPGPAVTEVLRLAVYDRWGGEVFLRENIDPNSDLDAWDGTRPGGRNPSVGVYVYELQVRLFNGEVIRTAGEVLVMR